MNQKLQPGDRVTRQKFLDDGTWHRYGDKCLKRSPLLHGTVIKIFQERRTKFNRRAMYLPLMCRVRWDETGQEKEYFLHGVDKVM